ncbi:MAG: hypothetical protein QOK27_838, partial [Gemmatimonadales bacterium]|nr:hypothetical protein [Gemmatimonadales bacterium]
FDSEQAAPTPHPKILCAKNAELPAEAAALRNNLIKAAVNGRDDAELRAHLALIAQDYQPGVAPRHPLVVENAAAAALRVITAEAAA